MELGNSLDSPQIARCSAVKARTQAANQIDALVTAPGLTAATGSHSLVQIRICVRWRLSEVAHRCRSVPDPFPARTGGEGVSRQAVHCYPSRPLPEDALQQESGDAFDHCQHHL